MNKYIYTDHKKEEVIFEVEEEDILKADKAFLKEKGFNISKHNYIGCEIVFKTKM
jgi:hypothetical protein